MSTVITVASYTGIAVGLSLAIGVISRITTRLMHW